MNARLTYVVLPLLTLILIGAGTWWWFETMEKRWTTSYAESDVATHNPMLAAQRLLERHNHPVQVEETLSTVLFRPVVPRGTLILAANDGLMNKLQVRQMLSWVARGNNLIMTPAWHAPIGNVRDVRDANDGDDASDSDDQDDDSKEGGNAKPHGDVPSKTNTGTIDKDDVGAHFGVALNPISGDKEICRNENVDEEKQKQKLPKDFALIDCTADITMPDGAYALHLGPAQQQLTTHGGNRKMLFFDQEGKAVRSYAYGKGQVIFVAQNYFDNNRLASYDRGELLLALADQNQGARRVMIVQRLDSPPWYRVLWAMVPQTLIAAGVTLLLLGWAAVRRFGPLLPEPNIMRRSMLEHVEASSRWLWKSAKGREVLMDAARAATMKVLLRRVPQLHAANEQEKVDLLAEQTGLLRPDIDTALHNIASIRPHEFTRQIQTLQRLRKHYER